MRFDEHELLELQKKIGMQAVLSSRRSPEQIKYIAGFDVAFVGGQMVCAAVVLDFKTLTVVERKHSVGRPQMPYISGFRAFRDGPAIIQTYYDIEHEPDVLMVSGHGVAHQNKCGLATYVGVELEKPAIGVAKSLTNGKIEGSGVLVDNEVRGVLLQTRQHAKSVIVSPGHLMSISDAASVVQHCIIPPHKLPEPLHAAHKVARQVLAQLMHGDVKVEESDDFEEGGLEEFNKMVL
ncbi:MAG: endonuclease V [Candidatus Aenigmarchaeota archaeon]|nr:endonuclease V [Candidatus Aenigmarchaeota archaeon]